MANRHRNYTGDVQVYVRSVGSIIIIAREKYPGFYRRRAGRGKTH